MDSRLQPAQLIKKMEGSATVKVRHPQNKSGKLSKKKLKKLREKYETLGTIIESLAYTKQQIKDELDEQYSISWRSQEEMETPRKRY